MSETRRTPYALLTTLGSWIAVLVTGSGALFGVLDDAGRSGSGVFNDVAQIWITAVLGVCWLVGTGSLALRSTTTLTVARLVLPLSLPVAIWLVAADATSVDASLNLIASALASAAVMSGDIGASFVQASAYGAERRSLLRPPPVYVALGVLNWLIAAAALVASLVLVVRNSWIGAVIAVVISVGAIVLGWNRWHRLSRRWLVLVPAGLVVHDHLLLADTAMLPKKSLLGVGAAVPGSGSLDLTGDASGRGVEIHTRDAETIRLAASPTHPSGTVVHARALRVAPTRPGSFLGQVREHGIPTGTVTA